MGYDTNIVKDRMVQLRNRYHLEKKRLETLKVENPTRCVESKWVLFDRLSFLSDHIPVRRSFRTLRCKRPYSDSEYAVKTEPESDAESDVDQGGDYEYKPGRKEPVHHNRTNGKSPLLKQSRYSLPTKPLASQPAPAPAPSRYTRLPRQIYASRHAQALYQRNLPQPINRSPQGSEKFLAFGQFLTSSLMELPEKDALLLVNQFTSELVQSYLGKDNQEEENQKVTPDEDPKQLQITVNCNGHDDNIQFTE